MSTIYTLQSCIESPSNDLIESIGDIAVESRMITNKNYIPCRGTQSYLDIERICCLAPRLEQRQYFFCQILLSFKSLLHARHITKHEEENVIEYII